MSSGDLSRIDLFVAAGDDVEDLTCNVSFDTTDCLEFGMALCYTPRDIFPGLRIRFCFVDSFKGVNAMLAELEAKTSHRPIDR